MDYVNGACPFRGLNSLGCQSPLLSLVWSCWLLLVTCLAPTEFRQEPIQDGLGKTNLLVIISSLCALLLKALQVCALCRCARFTRETKLTETLGKGSMSWLGDWHVSLFPPRWEYYIQCLWDQRWYTVASSSCLRLFPSGGGSVETFSRWSTCCANN